jgi:hypothetical protein
LRAESDEHDESRYHLWAADDRACRVYRFSLFIRWTYAGKRRYDSALIKIGWENVSKGSQDSELYGIHQDTTVGLLPLTVFVGPNGGGKSAFFDALLNFSMLARGNLRQAFGPYPFSFRAAL